MALSGGWVLSAWPARPPRKSFARGMQGCSGGHICEALWKFFIDAGGNTKKGLRSGILHTKYCVTVKLNLGNHENFGSKNRPPVVTTSLSKHTVS